MTLMISLLRYARTEVSIAVLLRIQVVWDMMVCDLVRISGIAQQDAAIIFKVQQIEDEWLIA